jgi:glycerol-3-phosphate dehydrogenase
MSHLGKSFGAELTKAEVRYLAEFEFATSSDDILWRRSRLGLRIAAKDRKALEVFLNGLAERPAG